MGTDYGVNAQTNDRVTATLIDVDLITSRSADEEGAATTEKRRKKWSTTETEIVMRDAPQVRCKWMVPLQTKLINTENGIN